MRVRVLFVCAVLASLAAQDEYKLRTKAPRTAEVERILARTDAFQDQWLGEQDYEAINAIIQKNKAGLPWPAGLIERFRKLDVWELKIVASNRARADESSTVLGLRVELGGEAADGLGRLSLTGSARVTFARVGAEWTASKLELGRMAEVRQAGNEPRFRDVTERALGHNSAYREQLAKGLDEWRSVLVEATGMDVYGHNGIAVGDYDGDGREDLYVCQPSGLPNRLLRNRGDGTFDDVSAAAGAPNLIILSGNRKGKSEEEGMANTVACLNQLKKHAEDKNVVLCMELLNSKVNHPDYQCDRTAWGVEVCKRVNSPNVKLLYDIYHMQIMEGDVIRTIRDNYQWIGHFHTAGNPGRNELSVEQEINYKGIAKAIADLGYKGFICHEYTPKVKPWREALEEALQACTV